MGLTDIEKQNEHLTDELTEAHDIIDSLLSEVDDLKDMISESLLPVGREGADDLFGSNRACRGRSVLLLVPRSRCLPLPLQSRTPRSQSHRVHSFHFISLRRSLYLSLSDSLGDGVGVEQVVARF